MRRTFILMVPFAAALVVVGCLQATRHFTINPDGSGKVSIEATMTQPEFLMGAEEQKDRKKRRERLLEKVGEIIGRSEGIDVWKDVSYRDLDGGKIFFKGTAYFPDFNTVRFHGVSNMNFRLGMDRGEMTLTIADESQDSNAQTVLPEDSVTPSLSDAEVERRADSMQQEFKMSMAMLRIALDGLSETVTFRLPGRVTRSEVFSSAGKGAYQLVFSGKRLAEVMDSLAAQRAFFVNMARQGGKPPMDDEQSKRAVWGGRSPLLVCGPGSKPLFNYPKEVAAARRSYEKLKKTLKVE